MPDRAEPGAPDRAATEAAFFERADEMEAVCALIEQAKAAIARWKADGGNTRWFWAHEQLDSVIEGLAHFRAQAQEARDDPVFRARVLDEIERTGDSKARR